MMGVEVTWMTRGSQRHPWLQSSHENVLSSHKMKIFTHNFWFWFREIHRKYSKPGTKTQMHQNTSFRRWGIYRNGKIFFRTAPLYGREIISLFVLWIFIPPLPLSHCKLRVMMRLRICGFLSCRRDSGLDGWWTDCSTSKSSERERQGVWTSVNDAECSSMMSFPCMSSPVSYMALLLTLRMHSFPETWPIGITYFRVFTMFSHQMPPTLFKPCIYTLLWFFSCLSSCCLNSLIYPFAFC